MENADSLTKYAFILLTHIKYTRACNFFYLKARTKSVLLNKLIIRENRVQAQHSNFKQYHYTKEKFEILFFQEVDGTFKIS